MPIESKDLTFFWLVSMLVPLVSSSSSSSHPLETSPQQQSKGELLEASVEVSWVGSG